MSVDVAEKYIRVHVAEPNSFKDDSFRITWIAKEKDIKAVVGYKKDSDITCVQSFLYDVEEWLKEDALEQVQANGYEILWNESDGIDLNELGVYDGESALCEVFGNPTVSVAFPAAEVQLSNEESSADIYFEGYAVTDVLIEDRKLRIPSSAWKWKGAFELFNGRVLGFHLDRAVPVGQILEYKVVDGKGVYVKGRLFAENDDLFLRAVRTGVLRAFSIGFNIIEWTYNEKTELLTVNKGRFEEVSVVNIGADKGAGFVVRNSEEVNSKLTKRVAIEDSERRITLSTELENKALEKLEEAQTTLGSQYKKLESVIAAAREEQTKFAESVITKTELKERFDRILEDVAEIAKDVQEAKQSRLVDDQKVAFKDYRSMLDDNLSWLTDDDGNKVGRIAQRAHCLFQMPVDYDKMTAGHELKNLRDLHDAIIISDAMHRFRKSGRPYNLQSSELFKQLVNQTAKFDKDVSLAMAGGNTGFGAEWLPEEMSAEFNEYLRKMPTLPNRFLTWNMPKGGSAKFPFQNGKATVYLGSEALVDNATEARKTNVATGVKTFTPEVFIGALISSEELTEDSILDMVSFIRSELATALNEGLESAIINGDDSTTHFDNTVDTVYQAYNVETGFKGLRKLADGNAVDIETEVTGTGVGTLALMNFTYAKGRMGVAGVMPADCLYVTGIKGKNQVQNALFKEDALGVLAFMISGTLPTIDGSEVYISALYDEALSSAGIRDSGADTKHTSVCCVHKPSFRIGQRRGITVEYEKAILTQQQQFVATARWDYGKISADAIEPVSGMENVQHTA